jgi:O-phospho-L-seryl-tRNASec:L-selenocysteinyl-tRNA synthase
MCCGHLRPRYCACALLRVLVFNLKMEELLCNLVNESYVQQGLDALKAQQNLMKSLLSERKLPLHGWDEPAIEYVLHQLSTMDSNNFPGNVGLGEREGRIYSRLISKRHFALSHGIGRSGDIAEVQPKAAGSSILYKLTNYLVQDAIHISGFNSLQKSLVLPLATGMSISLCLLALKQKRPNARYVIWPRIDQKSCFKSILTAGLTPLIVENEIVGDEIRTDISAIQQLFESRSSDEILCVLTTTSCFAPRRPDKIDEVAELCKQYSVPHVINNAYGLQCPSIAKLVNRAVTIGRVDYVIQSTDKNFMVPVGGAIVSSPTLTLIDDLSQLYPGRASSSPIVDLFITLLAMGRSGLMELHTERLRCLPILIDGAQRVAARYGERVLISPCNSISIGITLSQNLLSGAGPKAASFVGSMLFKRSVSGARVVATTNSSISTSKIGVHTFIGWGAHTAVYPYDYLTVACSVGLQEQEIHTFLTKLNKVFQSIRKSSTSLSSIPNEINLTEDEQGGMSATEESAVLVEPSLPSVPPSHIIAAEGGEEMGDGRTTSFYWVEMLERKAKKIGK